MTTPENAPHCTRQKAIDSILGFYTLLTQLPYIPAEKLMLPPRDGWETNILNIDKKGILDEIKLRDCGKTDAVIDTLRHLPYFNQTLHGDRWTVADCTHHINYAIGQTYRDYLEKDEHILPLPGHIIWLTEGFERAGVYLLLDTHTWEIIEYTILGESIQIDYEAYEALPFKQRYTAYARMPVDYYMELWKWRHITLHFMLVSAPGKDRGTAEFFLKDPRLVWEESWVPDDEEQDREEYSPGEENDESENEDEDLTMEECSGSGDDDDDDDDDEVRRELEDLSLPDLVPPTQVTEQQQHGNNIRNKSMLFRLATSNREDLYRKPGLFEDGEDVKKLIAIYHTHGWPVPEHQYRTTGRFEIPSSSLSPAQWPPQNYILNLSNFDREGCLTAIGSWHQAHQERKRAEWK